MIKPTTKSETHPNRWHDFASHGRGTATASESFTSDKLLCEPTIYLPFFHVFPKVVCVELKKETRICWAAVVSKPVALILFGCSSSSFAGRDHTVFCLMCLPADNARRLIQVTAGIVAKLRGAIPCSCGYRCARRIPAVGLHTGGNLRPRWNPGYCRPGSGNNYRAHPASRVRRDLIWQSARCVRMPQANHFLLLEPGRLLPGLPHHDPGAFGMST